VTNAGSSKIYGFEAQVQAQVGNFGADTGVSFVRSILGNTLYINPNSLPGGGVPLGPQCGAGVSSNPPACFNYDPYTQDLAGGVNPYSPEWTINAGVEYKLHLGAGGMLTPRIDYSFSGRQYATIESSALESLPCNSQADMNCLNARHLWNAKLGYDYKQWQFTAYVLNLTNDIYISGSTYGPSWFLGPPRQFGIRIRRDFSL
jgi:iron complex outermembrane recepter protein